MTTAEAAINEKAHYKIDIQIQTELLDRIYTKTRQKIREKGGMISHGAAMKLVLQNNSLKQIEDELFNEKLDDLAKENPLLAEKLRNRDPEGLTMLDLMIEELESPD